MVTNRNTVEIQLSKPLKTGPDSDNWIHCACTVRRNALSEEKENDFECDPTFMISTQIMKAENKSFHLPQFSLGVVLNLKTSIQGRDFLSVDRFK